MDFFSGPIPKGVDLKDQDKILKNPILYEEENGYNVTILLDSYYTGQRIKNLVKLIKHFNKDIFPRIIFPFATQFTSESVKSNVVDFYGDKLLDLTEFIKPEEKIVAVGRMMYAILESDDLEIKGFYDIVFNKTYFYDPKTKAYIYPVDGLKSWFLNNRDNWQSYFFHTQVKKCAFEDIEPVKLRRIKKEVVEEPNSWLKAHTDKAVKMACDIETKRLDPWNDDSRILEVTVSFDGRRGYLLPWDKIDVGVFSDFIKDKKLIMQNGKYDTKFFILNGVPRENIYIYHDTWNGSNVINEMQKSSLKSDAWLYTIHGGYDKELDDYLKKYPDCKKDYSLIPIEKRYPYAIMDAIVTYQIYEKQKEIFDWIDEEFPLDNGWSINKYFYEVQMLAVNTFLDVELEGMYINWDLLREYSMEMESNIKEVEKEILNYFGLKEGEISLDSGNELGALLEVNGWENHGRAKLKPTKKVLSFLKSKYEDITLGKEGFYLTGDEQLVKWKKDGRKDIVEKIEKYRELTSMMKTFIGKEEDNSGFFQYRKKDGKIHSTFGPMLTSSHRNWSKTPNLQNIPKHGKKAEWYRKIFCPPSEDYYIVEMDAAGFQLRIGAIYSNDPAMRKVFTELGGDMHSMTGQNVLKRDLTLQEFLKLKRNGDNDIIETRFKAKGINFGFLFGMVAFTFAKNVIEREWDKKDVYKYVRDNNLLEIQKRRLSLLNGNKGPNERRVDVDDDVDIFGGIEDPNYFSYCWAVASDIRSKFFETYNGLEKWIRDQSEKADRQGYIRSPFGAIRRLPQLLYKGNNSNSGIIKNLHNIAANSPVQDFENVYMMILLGGQNQYCKDNNLKSRVCGNVHDANILYIHKEEFDSLAKFSKNLFELDRVENNGIPQELEIDKADYFNGGQVWGFGTEVKL